LNKVLLEFLLLFPDLLNFSRFTFNQVLRVNLFLLSLLFLSVTTDFLLFLDIVHIVARSLSSSLRLLSEHKCLELNVEHLYRPQTAVGKHRMKQMSVTE
jgi:hypothetical protein